MKTRKGYVYQAKKGIWYSRFTYTDNEGRRRNVKRRARNKTHGKEILKKVIGEFEKGGKERIDASKVSFNDLADFYEKNYVAVKGYVKVFRTHFGRRKLSTITYEDLRTFRNERINTSTHQSKQRSLSTINRELAYLRRILNIAERNNWIAANPFKKGDALIHTSDEVKRDRILTFNEEKRLLNACIGYRSHLRPIIKAALDTGCRLGELLKLRWSEVNLENRIITIRAFNTKTMREREVSITKRLMHELETLLHKAKSENDLLFGIKCEIRKGFKSACRNAELEGVRFHDLRHTHASRLDDLGFSLAKIGGQLGHTVIQTTLRYVNRDEAAIYKVAEALDWHQPPF